MSDAESRWFALERARFAVTQGDYDAAKAAARALLQRDARDVEVLRFLGNVCAIAAGRGDAPRGIWPTPCMEALVHYERAIEIDPECAEVLFDLGDWHAGAGHAERASGYYHRALVAVARVEDWEDVFKLEIALVHMFFEQHPELPALR